MVKRKHITWILGLMIFIITIAGATADNIFFQGNDTQYAYGNPLILGYGLNETNATDDGLIWVNMSVHNDGNDRTLVAMWNGERDVWAGNDMGAMPHRYQTNWAYMSHSSTTRKFFDVNISTTTGTFDAIIIALDFPNQNFSLWVNDTDDFSLAGYVGNGSFNDEQFNPYLNRTQVTNGEAGNYLVNVTIYAKSTATPAGNWTLQAQSNETGNNILNFNVTINGNMWNTTTGVIETNITANGTLYNVTYSSNGFVSYTIQEANSSTDPYTGNMTQTPLEPTASINDTTPNVGDAVNITCNITNPESFTTTIIYSIYNTNDTTETNQTESNYTIQPEDFYDHLQFYCYVNTSWLEEESNHANVSEQTIDLLINFNAVDYNDNIITTVFYQFLNISQNRTSNPTFFLSTFLTNPSSTNNETINLTDTSLKNRENTTVITINGTQEEYNISLPANRLTITFVQNSTYLNTSGYIVDENRTRFFNETPVIIVQQDMEDGDVGIYWGLVNGVNYTQYYEYQNNYTTHVSETLEILQQLDWYAYFQVIDYSGAYVEDAIIRTEFSYHHQNISWNDHDLIGQRIVKNEPVLFWFDSRGHVLVTVTAVGYEPYQVLLPAGGDTGESYTKDNPFEIRMRESTTSVASNAWLYVKPTYTNTSTTIPISMTALGYDKVEITTDYRQNNGLEWIDISEEATALYRYDYTLTNGTDYDQSTFSDIILMVRLDGTNTDNTTIAYDENAKTELLTWTAIDSELINPILFIALILLSAFIGMILNEEEISITTFKIGAIGISFISTSFMWLSVVVLISWLAKGLLQKVVGE